MCNSKIRIRFKDKKCSSATVIDSRINNKPLIVYTMAHLTPTGPLLKLSRH